MDEERGLAIPTRLLPLALGVVALVVFLLLRSRGQSEDEQELSPIVDAIDDAELPERAKELLLAAVEEVRQTLGLLRAITPRRSSE